MSDEIKFQTMSDLDLQRVCLEAGHAYAENIYPGLRERDLERHAQIANACAAGYSRGYRMAQEEHEANKV